MILTTAGSMVDTMLAVYTGSSVDNLSLLVCNDDGYVWPVTTGPDSDPISRVKFNAVAGTSYRIAVAKQPGAVFLNFPVLAIEEIVAQQQVQQPNRSVSFSANLRISNLKQSPSGGLRLRVFAQAGYTYIDVLQKDCGKGLPSLNLADLDLGTVDLSPVGGASSMVATVAGVCPPPTEAGDWGVGWGVFAVLEEETGGVWYSQDRRLIALGAWPRVNGFIGPGGGVIMLGFTGKASDFGILSVRLGPADAIAMGAAWRISPTNCADLCAYAHYLSNSTVSVDVGSKSTNFTIEVKSVDGLVTPTNRVVKIALGTTTTLDLFYYADPPRLTLDRAHTLGLLGKPATQYRIESTQVLRNPSTWSTWTNITLGSGLSWQSGRSIIGPSPSNRFFRAVSVP